MFHFIVTRPLTTVVYVLGAWIGFKVGHALFPVFTDGAVAAFVVMGVLKLRQARHLPKRGRPFTAHTPPVE